MGEETGSNPNASFISAIDREDLLYTRNDLPSPTTYKPNTNMKYMIKGRVHDNFGSDANREPMHHRDIAKSPFVDPTKIQSPSPTTYKSKQGFLKIKK